MASCSVCGSASTQCCSRCKSVYYCGKIHQQQDWPRHKSACGCYRVEESETRGRYLVASRTIKAGQLIIREPPLVHGPKLLSAPLCPACYRPVSGVQRCPRCQLPTCGSAECNSADGIHGRNECPLVASQLERLRPLLADQARCRQVYQVVAPLRLLLLRRADAAADQTLERLVSHSESRRQMPLYVKTDLSAVTIIRQLLRVEDFDTECIRSACGILDTNTFEVRLPGRVKMRAVYPTVSLLNHDCRPNTRHTFDSQLNISIWATCDIAPGQVISVTYTQTLWPTSARRSHLFTSKHFWCCCPRCSDSEEFGTRLSALKCPDCSDLILCRNPLDETSDWTCRGCGRSTTSDEADQRHEQLRVELRSLAATCRQKPRVLEEFIDKCSRCVHPSSCHVLEARLALNQIYGNADGFQLDELSDEQLATKIDCCRHLLRAADVLEPGSSQFRAQILFELQAVLEHQAQRLHAHRRISKQRYQAQLQEASDCLRQSGDILRHNPDMAERLDRRRRLFQNLGAE